MRLFQDLCFEEENSMVGGTKTNMLDNHYLIPIFTEMLQDFQGKGKIRLLNVGSSVCHIKRKLIEKGGGDKYRDDDFISM